MRLTSRALVARLLPTAAVAVSLQLVAAPAAEAQQVARDSSAAADSTKAPGTVLHTVKRGDTLWDIAKAYLGDAFKWPELFRSNSGRVRNPNLIYPGQQLVVGPDGRPMFGPRPVASRTGGEPAGDADVNQGGSGSGPQLTGRRRGPMQIALLQNRRDVGRTVRETVRPGEALTAPFLVPNTQRNLREGRLVERAEPSVVMPATRDQFQFFDIVDVVLPEGVRGAIGQQFTVYNDGPVLKELRQRVVHPVGVVELVAVGGGRAARAQVVAMWQTMRAGDRLLPVGPLALPGTVRPQPVKSDEEYDVVWIDGNVVLPTIQNHVVLALEGGKAPKVGDQFVLFEEGYYISADPADISPDTEVAVISIVHVGNNSATGVIVGHEHPAIVPGMRARLIARMP